MHALELLPHLKHLDPLEQWIAPLSLSLSLSFPLSLSQLSLPDRPRALVPR